MKRRTALKTISIGVGVTVTGSALMGVLSSCRSETKSTGWQPSYLSPRDASLVTEIADIILPATETPGAKEVGVIVYMDGMIDQVYKAKDKEKFAAGLADFKNKIGSYKEDDDSYDIDREEISGLVHEFLGKYKQEEWDDFNGMVYGDPPDDLAELEKYSISSFLKSVKDLSIAAYFGSEIIGTEHLSYLPVPGEYLGCIPLSDVGNSWSLG